MTVCEIKIYFDTICPWCYIGHRILARAIELYQRTYPGGSSDTFTFTLLPYYLRPDAPVGAEGVPWDETVARKNGAEKVNAIRTRLQRVGRGVGIEFSFNSKIGNTRDSHRLIRHVVPEKRKELLEAIYQMHFEQDGDITSHADLVRAAESVGMDAGEVKAFLGTADYAEEVDSMAAEARREGVSSVPTIVIGGTRIEGAEDMGEFYEALVAAKEAVRSA
ncbi:hypothetical protein LTR37_009210 [Vermiconidia calcicola]|uniref:Uncharacterized protein n=1 Tax=Vermiconidia calcicola TaxID=1690605 RepID=A0ACC3N8F2_9PEZI|nr:hypothetical protein LTR37_009210 [Vermiconidia calcicola]